jgi:N-sulfoglucosamine sulfohydrolase
MNSLMIVMVSLFVLSSCTGGKQNKERQKPNILLITADDHGIQLGCYGDEIARTPNLDKLASQGVLFQNAYVTQASCSPSRSSILTGLYPHQSGQIGLSHRGFSMRDGIPNLVSTLKQNGYRTGILGKLHVQPENEYPFDLKLTAAQPTRDVKWVADTAKVFLQSSDEPFLLYVNFCDPHVQFYKQVKGIPEDTYDSTMVNPFPWQGIDQPEELTRIAGYYNCVARLDEGVGMLLKTVEDLGEMDNTLVIYIGDHGAPFTRGKTSCYESGIQIPCIMKYVNQVKANTQSDAFVSTLDILPTILEASHIDFNSPMEGNSLFKTLAGEEDATREYLFSEFTFHTHKNFSPRRAVRNKRFKLIHNLLHGEKALPSTFVDGDMAYRLSRDEKYDGTKVRDAFDRLANPPEYELYDLQEDPYEFTNLADNAKYADELNELKTVLLHWREETDDPLLKDSIVNAHLKQTRLDIANMTQKRTLPELVK